MDELTDEDRGMLVRDLADDMWERRDGDHIIRIIKRPGNVPRLQAELHVMTATRRYLTETPILSVDPNETVGQLYERALNAVAANMGA